MQLLNEKDSADWCTIMYFFPPKYSFTMFLTLKMEVLYSDILNEYER